MSCNSSLSISDPHVLYMPKDVQGLLIEKSMIIWQSPDHQELQAGTVDISHRSTTRNLKNWEINGRQICRVNVWNIPMSTEMMILLHLSMNLMEFFVGLPFLERHQQKPFQSVRITRVDLMMTLAAHSRLDIHKCKVYAFKCPLPLPYVNYKINDFPHSLPETNNQSNFSVNQYLVDCIHLYTVLGIHQFSIFLSLRLHSFTGTSFVVALSSTGKTASWSRWKSKPELKVVQPVIFFELLN